MNALSDFRAPAPSADKLARVKNLIGVMIADGSATPNELAFLAERCTRLGVPAEELNRLMANPQAAQFTVPETLRGKAEHIVELVAMMFADGQLQNPEVGICMTAALKMGIAENSTKRLVETAINTLAQGGNLELAVSRLEQLLHAESSVPIAPVAASFVRASAVPFARIPTEIREVLARASRGEKTSGYARLKDQSSIAAPSLVALAGLLVALATLFGLARSLPSGSGVVLRGLLACAGLFGLFLGGFEIARWLRSKQRPSVLLSHAMVIRTRLDGESVDAIRLADLQDARQFPKAVALIGAGGAESMRLPGLLLEARQIQAAIATQRRLGREALAPFDWLDRLAGASPAKLPPRLIVAVAALVLAGVVGVPSVLALWVGGFFWAEARSWDTATRENTAEAYAGYVRFAMLAPDPFGFVKELSSIPEHKQKAELLYDDRRFEAAQKENTIRTYRRYVVDASRRDQELAEGGEIVLLGRFAAHAKVAIAKLYREKADAYAKVAGANGADPTMVSGVKEILEWLGRDAISPDAKLIFLTPAQADIDSALKRATSAEKVASVGSLFTSDLNANRKSEIAQELKSALATQFDDSVLHLSEDVSGKRPRFLVHSSVVPSGDVYFMKREAHLPVVRRKAYPGVNLEFNFTLQVPDDADGAEPDPRKGRRLKVEASPAPSFSVATQGDEYPPDSRVYGKMIGTAFVDFRIKMMQSLGFRSNAKYEEPVERPSPPARVSGSNTNDFDDILNQGTCPEGMHAYAGGCYRCPSGSYWVGEGKCRRYGR